MRDVSLVGRWVSSDLNYSIDIRGEGIFKFCERDNCVDGNYESYNEERASSVKLIGLGKSEIGHLFLQRYMPFDKSNDLEMNIDESIYNFPSISDKCKRKPCVAIGGTGVGEEVVVFSKERA